MGRINRSYLKDRFLNKQVFQQGGAADYNSKFLSTFSYRPSGDTEFNSTLAPGGTPEVQKYQKQLNEQYGSFLKEDGAWGPKTQSVYEKYIVQKQPVTPFQKTKYRPTLEEFKSMYERIPKYNQGYESIYDVNPNFLGVQQGPLTPERSKEVQNLPSEETLRQKYLQKTFGNLPVVQGSAIYDGYSPTRIWTGVKPFVPYSPTKEVNKFQSNPTYLYMLAPKQGTTAEKDMSYLLNNDTNNSGLPDFSLDDLFEINAEGKYVKPKNPELVKKFFNNHPYLLEELSDLPKDINQFTPEHWARVQMNIGPSERKDNIYNPLLSPRFWDDAATYGEELQQNPEIVDYAKKNNIDLSSFNHTRYRNSAQHSSYAPAEQTPLGGISFASQIPEAILVERYAKTFNKPVIRGTGNGQAVIQDPTQFNLMGYTPVTPELAKAFGYSTNTGSSEEKRYEKDPILINAYLNKAGVPNDPNIRKNITYFSSPFPIQEYVPRINAAGEIYKKGGLKQTYLSTKGYKRNSPDVNNPYNVIPSNQITMEDVDFPVMGIDDLGNQQLMQPGKNYTFPGNYVTEFPLRRFQSGGVKRMPRKAIKNILDNMR